MSHIFPFSLADLRAACGPGLYPDSIVAQDDAVLGPANGLYTLGHPDSGNAIAEGPSARLDVGKV